MEPNAKIAQELVNLINELRRSPKGFANNLQTRLNNYEGNNYTDLNGTKFRSVEGVKACKEALEFLQNCPAVPELVSQPDIQRCAQDHCDDLCKTGETSHSSSDGTSMGKRMDKYGVWSGKLGECIAVQSNNAMDFLLQWLIDDGVSTRGDRKTILSKEFSKVGVGVNLSHKTYKTCAVVVFAGVFGKDGSSEAPVPVQNDKLIEEMPEDLKKMPDGAKGMAVTRKTLMEGDKKRIVYHIRYDMEDGTTKETTKEYS
jgi:hypothetical protein